MEAIKRGVRSQNSNLDERIDRAIPLGLALVESVLAGLEAEDAHLVVVRIGDLDDLRVKLRVSTDGVLAADRPNAKLIAGLALQLDATVESPDVGTIIRWRFQAGPLPVLAATALRHNARPT
jgi:hypothetical protein